MDTQKPNEEQRVTEGQYSWDDPEAKKLVDMELNDPATWPGYMFREIHRALYETRSVGESGLFVFEDNADLRRNLLDDAGNRHFVRQLTYLDALLEALRQRVQPHSLEDLLLLNFEKAAQDLYGEAIEFGVSLAPKLDRAVPPDYEDFMTALGYPRPARPE